jgi:hypothetical protein
VYQVDDEENPRTREDYAFLVGENRTDASGDYSYDWWSPAGWRTY